MAQVLRVRREAEAKRIETLAIAPPTSHLTESIDRFAEAASAVAASEDQLTNKLGELLAVLAARK